MQMCIRDRYTILCGLGAAAFLGIVYFMLTYVGAMTITPFENGGSLLHAVTNHLFGSVGGIILGIAVLFACLTTAIGLTTSFSDYFQTLLPRVSYKKIAAFVCLFSFVISNVGLSQLIKIALPDVYKRQPRGGANLIKGVSVRIEVCNSTS